MDGSPFILILSTFGVSAMTAFLAFWAIGHVRPISGLQRLSDRTAKFVFTGNKVLGANRRAKRLLDQNGEDSLTWAQFSARLSDRVIGFPRLPPTPPKGEHLVFHGVDRDQPALVGMYESAGNLIVDVKNWRPSNQGSVVSGHDHFDGAVEHAPFPIWHRNADGHLIWSNRAFRRLVVQFADGDHDQLFDAIAVDAEQPERVGLGGRDSGITWYDVTTLPIQDGSIFYAASADALVRSEAAQRSFVQTLAKTFAQLSIGLAIFDQDRQLILFNPALVDLTALPADFLSSRPNLHAFFDGMRELRMIPEPKDYSSWREQIADLVIAASDGRYSELWTLPTGLTYRVTGRPHPNGAVAFLFEDISAEISLTRQFRSELRLSQAVFDAQPQASAVFSGNGILTMSNQAYRGFWKVDPDSAIADVTLKDAIALWRQSCEQTEIWDKLSDYSTEIGPREPWRAKVVHREAGQLLMSITPISGSSTLVSFDLPPDLINGVPIPAMHHATI